MQGAPEGFRLHPAVIALRRWADGEKKQQLAGRILGVEQGQVSKYLSSSNIAFPSPARLKGLPDEHRQAILDAFKMHPRRRGDQDWKIIPVGRPSRSHQVLGYEILRARLRASEVRKTFVLSAMNMDYVYKVEAVEADHEESVDEPQRLPGGSGANTAYGLAKLGAPIAVGGILGKDDEGKALVRDLRSQGIDTSPLIQIEGRTGRATILSVRGGPNRAVYVEAGVNERLAGEFADATAPWQRFLVEALAQAGLVHISSFTAERERELLRSLPGRLRKEQVLSFTPQNHVAALGLDQLEELYARVNLLFVYSSHLTKLIERTASCADGQSPVDALFDWRRRNGVPGEPLVVVEKAAELGPIGRRSRDGAQGAPREIKVFSSLGAGFKDRSPRRVENRALDTYAVADSTGAGDAMAAGMMFGLWNNVSIDVGSQIAQVMSLMAGSGLGARRGLPDLAGLAEGWRHCYGTPWPL